MGFVNEEIPESDRIKHGIDDQSNFYRAGASEWTVDRKRKHFLVFRARYGLEGPQDVRFWAFSWRGHLLDVMIRNLDIEQLSEGHYLARKSIVHIEGLTPELEPKRRQILNDLTEALSVHGIAGSLIPFVSYQVELEDE